MSQCTIWGFKSMCEGYPPPSDVWRLSPLFWCVTVIIGYPPPSDVWRLSPSFWCVTVIIGYPPSDMWRLSPLFWCVTVIIGYPPPSDVWRLSPSFWCVTVIIGYPPPSDVWRLSPSFWCVTVIIGYPPPSDVWRLSPSFLMCDGYHRLSSSFWHVKAVTLVLMCDGYHPSGTREGCYACSDYHPCSDIFKSYQSALLWHMQGLSSLVLTACICKGCHLYSDSVSMLPSLFWHVKAVTPVLKYVKAIILVLMC